MRFYLVAMLALGCAAVSAETEDARHESAAQLVRLMDVPATMSGGAEAMADAMISQNAMLRPYKSVLIDWFAEVFAPANFEHQLVDIYAEAFSEDEILDLLAFYKTPTGQKMVQQQPELMKKGAALGEKLAEEKSSLLQEMIQRRALELEKLGN